jgi:hypothetical protein
LDFATIILFTEQRLSALCPTPNLYPHAEDSLFATFYDSQGYGRGILTHLHMRDNIIVKNNEPKDVTVAD